VSSLYRPKDITSVLKPLLPAKYSPLQQSGDGLQSVYLAAVPIARVLLDQVPGFSFEVLNQTTQAGAIPCPQGILQEIFRGSPHVRRFEYSFMQLLQ